MRVQTARIGYDRFVNGSDSTGSSTKWNSKWETKVVCFDLAFVLVHRPLEGIRQTQASNYGSFEFFSIRSKPRFMEKKCMSARSNALYDLCFGAPCSISADEQARGIPFYVLGCSIN